MSFYYFAQKENVLASEFPPEDIQTLGCLAELLLIENTSTNA